MKRDNVSCTTFVIAVAVVALLLSLFCVSSVNALDDCLDASISLGIASDVSPNGVITQPTTPTEITMLVNTLFNVIRSYSSPFANTVGVGFPNNDMYYVQSCYPYTNFCSDLDGQAVILLMVNYNLFRNYNVNLFQIIGSNSSFTFNLSQPVPTSVQYLANETTWWNSSGWSPAYSIFNINRNSRTYVIPTPISYANATTTSAAALGTARIISDRNADEPCNSCISRSPCIGLVDYVASKAPLYTWSFTSNFSQVAAIFDSLLNDYLTVWQIQSTINSVTVAYSNGDAYILTACSGTPAASSTPECQNNNPYLGEVRNAKAFGNIHLHAFAISETGAVTSTTSSDTMGRDEGVDYATTQRSWYVRGDGWGDPFVAANLAVNKTVYLRGFSKSFFNGVVFSVSNPNSPCPGVISSNRRMELPLQAAGEEEDNNDDHDRFASSGNVYSSWVKYLSF